MSEAGKEAVAIQAPRNSRWDFLRKARGAVRRFSLGHPKVIPSSEQAARNVPETEDNPQGIAKIIELEIEKKGLVPPEYKKQGAGNFYVTNERISPHTIEIVRNIKADGYLIGVGVTGILPLLEAFLEGQDPKGIILINPDPSCRENAELFIRSIGEGDLLTSHGGSSSPQRCYQVNWGEREIESVLDRFHPPIEVKVGRRYSKEEQRQLKDSDRYRETIREAKKQELIKERLAADPKRHQLVEAYTGLNKFYVIDIIGRRVSVAEPEFIDYLLRHPGDFQKFVYMDGRMPTVTEPIAAKHLEVLQKLAKEGNIAVVQQDLFNPQLLEIISRLPGLKESTNIVYLSNVSDWIYRSFYWPWQKAMREAREGSSLPEKPDYQGIFAGYQSLQLLNPYPPHKNFFAHTTSHVGYQMKIESEIPVFDEKSFIPG